MQSRFFISFQRFFIRTLITRIERDWYLNQTLVLWEYLDKLFNCNCKITCILFFLTISCRTCLKIKLAVYRKYCWFCVIVKFFDFSLCVCNSFTVKIVVCAETLFSNYGKYLSANLLWYCSVIHCSEYTLPNS